MANPRIDVEAPPVTPLPYGLLSAALVLDDLTGHNALGVRYEPAYCGPINDTTGACQPAPDFGTVSVSVADTAEATLTVEGAPAPTTYTIDWGDETPAASVGDPDGATHTYADPGTYVVLITDERFGYVASVTVTVTADEATGPFAADAGFSKVPTTGIDLVDGEPFTLYHLFQCSPVGLTESQMRDRAQAALRLGEQRAYERILGARLPLLDGAVDLTPTAGTPVSPARAVAILEQYAAASYGGVPVLHVPRDAGSLLGTAGTVIRSGTHLETVQGALVASGGGYDLVQGPPTDAGDPETVQPAAAGQRWLYVTGTAVVHRSPTIDVGPVMGRTPAVNVASMMVERLATVTVECVVGAVLADVTVVD